MSLRIPLWAWGTSAATLVLLAARPEDGYVAVLLARSLERQGRDAEAAPYLERARVLGQDV